MAASVTLNNPGAMMYAPWQRAYGGSPGLRNMAGTLASFPSPEQGFAAAVQLQHMYENRGLQTLNQRMAVYAPAAGAGNSAASLRNYVQHLATAMGISADTPFSITDPTLGPQFLAAQAAFEAGTPTNPFPDTALTSGYQSGVASAGGAPQQIASYSRGYTSDPSPFVSSTDTIAPGYTVYPAASQTAQDMAPAMSPAVAAYPDASSAVAALSQGGNSATPVPGATSLHPDVAQALGFAPTSGGEGTPTQYPAPIPSAAITAGLNPYSTSYNIPIQMGSSDGSSYSQLMHYDPLVGALNYASAAQPSADPAMGAAAASGLQGYSGLAPQQLPIAQAPNPQDVAAADPMAAAGAPPLAPAQAPGGVMATLGNIVHAVVSSPIGQHIATALQAPGGLTGITGFGGGPLPAGVSNADTFKSFLGGQNWEGPGTGRGASFDPISGGSHYQYFAPSTPGGIGGYVANGQVFTYPTEDTQNFFHTAGN